MKDLNLNDLLRYCFAGAIFFAFMLLAFEEPREIILEKDNVALVTAGIFVVGLTTGSVIYTLHRALPYPFFYWLFAMFNKRPDDLMEIDITRWKNLNKQNSFQSKMGEWGSQVHFLYCIAWAGLLGVFFGLLSCWTKTQLFSGVIIASLVFLFSAMWHHFRYQKWETRVFVEDEKIG